LLFGHKTDLITKPIVARLSKPKTQKPANHNICFMRVFSINDSLRLNGFYLKKTIAIGGVAYKITVGAVISKTENSLELVEWFNSKTNSWPLITG